MPMPIHLTLKGQKQGEIKGGCTQKGREGSIIIFAFDHDIMSPRDIATGLPTGKRQHRPVKITKEIDKSSPLLYTVLCTNENLTEVIFKFWKPSAAGTEKQYYTISFYECKHREHENVFPEHADRGKHEASAHGGSLFHVPEDRMDVHGWRDHLRGRLGNPGVTGSAGSGDAGGTASRTGRNWERDPPGAVLRIRRGSAIRSSSIFGGSSARARGASRSPTITAFRSSRSTSTSGRRCTGDREGSPDHHPEVRAPPEGGPGFLHPGGGGSPRPPALQFHVVASWRAIRGSRSGSRRRSTATDRSA